MQIKWPNFSYAGLLNTELKSTCLAKVSRGWFSQVCSSLLWLIFKPKVQRAEGKTILMRLELFDYLIVGSMWCLHLWTKFSAMDRHVRKSLQSGLGPWQKIPCGQHFAYMYDMAALWNTMSPKDHKMTWVSKTTWNNKCKMLPNYLQQCKILSIKIRYYKSKWRKMKWHGEK